MREALVGSTSQIAALGRNVNQIARSLNGASSVVSKQNLETLAAVADRVDRHVDLVGAVLLALRPVVAARRAIRGASRIRGTIAERWPAAKGQGSAAAPAQIPPTS
jgi:Bacterial mobilisation protein (MobC)